MGLTLLEAIKALADCYRATGADPDNNEDWRLAPQAVREVRRLRREAQDMEDEIAELDKKLKDLTEDRDLSDQMLTDIWNIVAPEDSLSKGIGYQWGGDENILIRVKAFVQAAKEYLDYIDTHTGSVNYRVIPKEEAQLRDLINYPPKAGA